MKRGYTLHPRQTAQATSCESKLDGALRIQQTPLGLGKSNEVFGKTTALAIGQLDAQPNLALGSHLTAAVPESLPGLLQPARQARALVK